MPIILIGFFPGLFPYAFRPNFLLLACHLLKKCLLWPGYGLDDWGTAVRFPTGTRDFSLFITSKPVMGPCLCPIWWVPVALSLRFKPQGPESDHPSPLRTEVELSGAVCLLPSPALVASTLATWTFFSDEMLDLKLPGLELQIANCKK